MTKKKQDIFIEQVGVRDLRQNRTTNLKTVVQHMVAQQSWGLLEIKERMRETHTHRHTGWTIKYTNSGSSQEWCIKQTVKQINKVQTN